MIIIDSVNKVNKVMYLGVDMYETVILISNKMFRTIKLAIKFLELLIIIPVNCKF